MHGDAPERIAKEVADMFASPESFGLPRMFFGIAGYAIVRGIKSEAQRDPARIADARQSAAGYDNYQQWLSGTHLQRQVSPEDYSVSNRGLRSGLIGSADQARSRIAEFEAAGVDLPLLRFSPQKEEMERFSAQVIYA